MDILLVAHFCDEVGLGGNNRFNYLASVLAEQGHNVELVTSSFSHTTKRPKTVKPCDVDRFKLTYIDEPAYAKNVSVRRFRAHRKMAKHLSVYLNTRARPDLVYCAVPSLSVAEVSRIYAESVNCPFVIDVQDLWPEAFLMVSELVKRFSFVFNPLQQQANRIYRNADGILAVSERYRNRALEVAATETLNKSLYLGTDLGQFDSFANRSVIKNSEEKQAVEFVYLGTLGHSYDLGIAIRAFKLAQGRTARILKLTILGDGPLQADFEALAVDLGVNVNFTGRLPYEAMVPRLVECDAALNVISAGAAQSIINKHADYAAAGLPILNTQECSEYRELIDTFEAGVHCDNKDPEELAVAMVRLAEDTAFRTQLAKGSRNMAEALFDRKATYFTVEKFLEAVIEQYREEEK